MDVDVGDEGKGLGIGEAVLIYSYLLISLIKTTRLEM